MHDLQIRVQKFLYDYCHDRAPLLLGLSGGPDSIALFYMLLGIKYPFEVAHIDHGWRNESVEESVFLAQICHDHHVCFHVKRLTPPAERKNLEDRGRRSRLEYFKEILILRNLKGVLLAHHADDQAETVLKRIFEGASLSKLKGLLPETTIEHVLLYRPFLHTRKHEILNWLKEKKIHYFMDPTNEDPLFLRSRLRNHILPTLSQNFGKEIASNLCKLGESASELNEFMEELLQPYRHQVQKKNGEVCLAFQNPPSSIFLWKAILRDFFESQGLTISRSNLDAVLYHLQKDNSHRKLKIRNRIALIHKKTITLINFNPL